MHKSNKISFISLCLITLPICVKTAWAANVPNTDDPSTFLGPIARLGITHNLGTDSAFSIAGEAGSNDARVGASLGWNIGENQRFKVTAEYLWQKINYGFFSGNDNYWAQQGAVGTSYQYDLVDVSFFPQLGFDAYVSHAPSKNFGLEFGTIVNSQGVAQNFTNNRRATGSNGFAIGPVMTVTPWQGGKITGEVNYENVGYDNDFPVNQNARGFGTTIELNQAINQHIEMGLSAAIRQPFNNFTANINWIDVPYYKTLVLGLFGNYAYGKHTLPDTYNIGISANFILDQREIVEPVNLKDETSTHKTIYDNLLFWTATPAVYMPVVMSVADEQVELS